MEQHTSILMAVVILLGAAVIAVPLLKKLGLGSVIGYLAAGVAVGPSGFSVVTDVESLRHLAEFGVVFLLFIIGLELHPKKLWAMRTGVFGLGSLQILVTGGVICGYSMLFGLSFNTALIIGLGLALSSTAMGLQYLVEKGELPSPHGQTAFSILLMQDIAVVPLIALVPLLSPGSNEQGDTIQTLALAAFAIGSVIAVGRYALQPFLRAVAKSGNREIFTGAAVLMVLGSAWLMESAGMSMALGAFLTGLLLSDSEFAHQVEADVEPFRGFLLGLFFMSVGMSIDLQVVTSDGLRVAGHVGALLLIKAFVLFLLCLAFGRTRASATRVALILSQSGEFGFVLFGVALGTGLLDPDDYQFALILIAITMAVTPLLTILAERLGAQLEVRATGGEELAEGVVSADGGIIIAGFGRVGKTVAMFLQGAGLPYCALDNRPGLISAGRKQGYRACYGDASSPDVLRAAGAGQAKLLVVAVQEAGAAERIIKFARESYPGLKIVARAYDLPHGDQLESLGATAVVPDSVESSLQMGRAALTTAGLPAELADEAVDNFRLNDYARLRSAVKDTD